MRAMFGLVALLVGAFVVVWLFSRTELEKAKVGRQAQEQVAGIGLQTLDGQRYEDTIKLDAKERNGKVVALVVRSIDSGGPMAKKLGLQQGDEIVEVGNQGGMQRVRDIDDVELAKNWVIEAPRGNHPLVVERDGKQLRLQGGQVVLSTPVPSAAAPTQEPAPAEAAAAAPGQPTPAEQAAPAGDQPQQAPATQPQTPRPPPQRSRGVFDQVQDIQDKLGGGNN